jgi:hypothetical protein
MMAKSGRPRGRGVLRGAAIAALALLTAFWVGLLVYSSIAFAKKGASGVTEALAHLFSNPFEGRSPTFATVIVVLCAYAALTAALVFAYWKLFAHDNRSREDEP